MKKRLHEIKVNNLSCQLVYILKHCPYEFGLVPDGEGFISIRELLKALHEDPEWSYVRQSHINEVLLGEGKALLEMEKTRIRATDIRWRLNQDGHPPSILHKILYLAIRRKAHLAVMEKGVKSETNKSLVLTPDRDFALKIGKRCDQHPVILEIMAEKAEKKGVFFHPFGNLFLCSAIAADFIAGPQVSKEIILKKSREESEKKEVLKQMDTSAGSFKLEISRDPDRSRKSKMKKNRTWKDEARKMRRRGTKMGH